MEIRAGRRIMAIRKDLEEEQGDDDDKAVSCTVLWCNSVITVNQTCSATLNFIDERTNERQSRHRLKSDFIQ